MAAALPAARLSRKHPIAALTLRGRESPIAPGPMRWRLSVALLGVVLALMAVQHATKRAEIGNLTTLLLALVACAVAAPLVRAGGGILIRTWPRLLGPTARFAASHLHQHSRQTSLMVATLGIGLGVVLMFGMLSWSVERTLSSQTSARFQADLVITSAFVSGGYLTGPFRGDIGRKVAKIPGVASAGGWQRRSITFMGGNAEIHAYDPSIFDDDKLFRWAFLDGALPDALRQVLDGEGAIVSRPFAHLFGIEAGDLVRLDSPRGEREFVVVAVTNTEPTTAIIINRKVYRQTWNDKMITWLFVSLREGAAREDVEAVIASQLGQRYRLKIQSSADLVDYLVNQGREAFRPAYLMGAITFLLVLIGTGETLATGVIERTREFGMMRAVGLLRSHLFRLVMIEGATIGLLGLVLAAVVGMCLGVFWVNVQFPALAGWVLDLHVPYAFALGAAGITIVLCIVGSFLPSLRAARISPVAALRDE